MIVWDSNSFIKQKEINAHADAIWSICFSHDDKSIVTCGTDKYVRTWDNTTDY